MKSKLWLVGLAVLMGALAVGGTVWAAESIRPGWLQGQVLDVGDMSLIIQTDGGEVEILVTEETAVRAPGASGMTLNDIQVGTHVLIQAKEDGDGVLTARIIVVRPTRRLQDNLIRGTVTGVDDGNVSVETADGAAATLFITSTTHLWVPGQPPTTTVELMVGDPVLAAGEAVPTQTGEKALRARLVVVVSDEDLPKFGIQGRAVAVTRQTIVVQTGRGERAMTVLPMTRIWSGRGRLDSLRNVHPGDQIIALGQPTEMGQWVAGLVLVPGPEPLAGNGLRGRVIDVDVQAGTLTVETEQRGRITVVTSGETQYRVPGVEQPSFEDIQVGNPILALGRFQEDDPAIFLARGIAVLSPPAGDEEA